ncbi:hypothetical protein GCK32_010011, partial [Trichostrongylus colubriformis]
CYGLSELWLQLEFHHKSYHLSSLKLMNNQLELSKAEFPLIVMIMFVTNLLSILCVRKRMSSRTSTHKCPPLSKSSTGVADTPRTKSTEAARTAKQSKSDEMKRCFEALSPGQRSKIDVEEDRSPKPQIVESAMTPTRSEPERTPHIEPMKTQRDE